MGGEAIPVYRPGLALALLGTAHPPSPPHGRRGCHSGC